jgi:hypothetical protein
MTPSTYQILFGRFGGNRKEAIDYCIHISVIFPDLEKEYWGYAEAIKNYVPS